jgi:tetratricopeptide (TPR) repeat protein
MLETIQEFARFKLLERGEVDVVARAHAEHALALAEAAEPELFGEAQAEWVRRLDDETGNLRAALSWSIESGALEVGLRIAGALTRFWSIRGHMSEGRRWLEEALRQDAPVAPEVRSKALFAAGYAALGQGDYGDASTRFEDALDAYRESGDEAGAAACLAQVGWLSTVRGDLDRAVAASEQSLSIARAHGDSRTASAAISNLAEAAERSGEHDRAGELFDEALQLRQELGDRRNIANALINLGRNEILRGSATRAASLLADALQVAESVDDTWGRSLALSSLACLALQEGDAATAQARLRDALALCVERGDKRVAAECLTTTAAASMLSGDPSRAARLAGAADGLRGAMGIPASPLETSVVERFLATAAALEEGYADDHDAGRSLSMERAISLAIEVLEVSRP